MCTSRANRCWVCQEDLGSAKHLKAHIAVRHSRLAVVCPGCHFEDKTFKRVSDLKFHYNKCHPDGNLPDEAFTEANTFWMAVYPEDVLRVIKPTKRNSEVARKTRTAIMTMLGASTCRRNKSKNDWYDGWDKEKEGYKPADHGTGVAPEYEPTPLSSSTTKKLLTPEPAPLTSSATQRLLTPQPTRPSKSRSRSPSPALSDSTVASSFVSKTPPFRPDYVDNIEPPSPELKITAINLLPEDCKAYLKEGELIFKVIIASGVFGCPKSMQALARRMAMLNLDHQEKADDDRLAPCRDQVKREKVMAALGIDQKLILSILVTPPLFEPPTKRSRMAELMEMSTTERALNLLKRGCFPLFQAARREWSEDQLKLQAGSVQLLWPPTGWKDLSGDLKLLQWEVAAYKLAEATRSVSTMPRSELLDRFNFLALPGTSCHHVPRVHKETVKGRFQIYERLRKLATGDTERQEDSKWLQILECGAMMRDTSEDLILDQIDSIPLRLREAV